MPITKLLKLFSRFVRLVRYIPSMARKMPFLNLINLPQQHDNHLTNINETITLTKIFPIPPPFLTDQHNAKIGERDVAASTSFLLTCFWMSIGWPFSIHRRQYCFHLDK